MQIVIVGARSTQVLGPRKLVTEVVASVVAISLAVLAFSNLKQEPQPALAVIPPLIHPASGKIVDRFGAEIPPDPVVVLGNAAALFAYALDLAPAAAPNFALAERPQVAPSAIVTGIQQPAAKVVEVAEQGTAAHSPDRGATKPRNAAGRVGSNRMIVADAAPLPPPRPSELRGPIAETALAVEAEPERTGFFGWNLPSELLPSSRKGLSKVASLGGAVIDRLTP